MIDAIAYAIIIKGRDEVCPFGMVVKMVRKKLAISQEQLARELRVSFSTVNRWENGRVKPSPMAIKAFKTFCEQKILCWKEV